MSYEELLNELHGLIGTHIYVTVSPATADGKNIAGFSGTLERGALADFPIASEGDEQLVFIVRPEVGGADGAQFTLSPSTFTSAFWADGPLARELVVRAGGVDIALMPTGGQT